MTRHTPDFLRQRSSNMSLRMAAAEKAASMSQSAVSLGAPAREQEQEQEPARTTRAADVKPEEYTRPFCDFLQENPTIFHARLSGGEWTRGARHCTAQGKASG